MRLDYCPGCGLSFAHKKRSLSHHRLFFAAVSAAFDNWPLEHRFLPSCEEHLRAWLLVQVGHHNVIGQNLIDQGDIFRVVDFTERLLTAVRQFGGYGFVEIASRKSIIVKYPKSIAYRELDQKAFAPIAEAVFQIIEEETGIKIENLKREVQPA